MYESSGKEKIQSAMKLIQIIKNTFGLEKSFIIGGTY